VSASHPAKQPHAQVQESAAARTDGAERARPTPAARLARLADDHHALLVAATLFAALLIRVGVLADLRRTVYFDGLMPDEDTYHRWAERLASGTDVAGFAPDFPRLPAIVFGAVYSLLGTNPLYIRVLNVLLGVAICAVVYWVGRMLYGRSAGLLAAALCAFSESLAFYSATLMNTCLGLLLFGLVIALGAWCLQEPRRHLLLKCVAAGAAAGLLANVRANAAIVAMLAIPAALAVARRMPARKPWLAAQLVALFIAAYAVSASASGELAGPRFGFNLYMGNNPDNATPYYRPVRFTSSAPEHQSVGFVVEASRRADRTLSIDEAERFWTGVVLERAVEEPPAFLQHLLWKLLAIVHSSPSDNNHDLRIVGAFLPRLGFAWLSTWLLLALGLACMAILPRDGRLAAGAAIFALYSATLAAFFAGERLRVPLLIVIAPYAGAGLLEILRALAARQRALLLRAGTAFVAAWALSRIPVPGADDLSGPTNMHALILLDQGDLDGAERWYRRSLALDGRDSEGARIGLAAILQKRGNLADAVAILEPLPDAHYEAASKYEWLGNLALARSRPQEARAAFEAAIELDASKQNAYKGLYIANRLLGDDAKAAAADARLQRIRAIQ
jgi:4-amino-4-deoxy-L-arabinose transferase-like glycosyltransferase